MEQRIKSICVHRDDSSLDCHTEQNTSINLLPPEILMKVFAYLPHRERLRVEEVCHQWQQCSQATWDAVRTLEISLWARTDLTTITNSSIQLGLTNLSVNSLVVRKVLSLCGETVTHLKIFMNRSSDQQFEIAFPSRVFELLSEYCHNLRSFEVTKLTIAVEYEGRFLSRNTQLESVKLSHKNTNLMSYLPLGLKELQTVAFMHPRHRKYLRKMTNLRHLNACLTPWITAALSTLENLTTLVISSVHPWFSLNSLADITKLSNLTYLDVVGIRRLNLDGFLVELSRKCRKIRELHADRNGKPGTITEVGLSAVSELPVLEVLDVSYELAMSDEVLVKFTKLRKLRISGCERLTGFGIILFIEMNQSLEELEVRDFQGETIEAVLAAAVDIVERRDEERAKVLNIVINYACPEIASAFDGKHLRVTYVR